MGSPWSRAKRLLALNLCVQIPRTTDEPGPADETASSRSSAASENHALMPTTPTAASGGLRLYKSGSRSSKKTCAICLGSMKPGHGHALFTAECSHTFHFHCIVSNVKYGNRVCPVCRAKWKEVPLQGPQSSEHSHGRARVNRVSWPQDEYMAIVRRLPRPSSANQQHHLAPLFHASEPGVFNDDEPTDTQAQTVNDSQHGCAKSVEIRTYPEFSAIQQSVSQDNFTILIHLKGPHASTRPVAGRSLQAHLSASQTTSRAPIDLVTVLDISGSMAGTKLVLLKRAMGFVIQNLGPYDRLSVVTFSSTARRLFPLCRMSDSGRQRALQAVNSLVSSGGTNIAEGLRKGAKVIEDRKEKNPVASIILLSDGQDTYNISSNGSAAERNQTDYQSLVPSSIRGSTSHLIPVHAFGFGADHDSASMHSIAETSGGTFSFIEAEGVIQDAFAQCIGGLLSVVVQGMSVGVECLHPNVRLGLIKSGSYTNWLANDGRTGSIDVGDLYADEERDFLVTVNIPPTHEETALLRVGCTYRDPVSKDAVSMEGQEVRIQRPEIIVAPVMSIEVDRQKNRVQAAEAMAEARAAAERGDLAEAVAMLEVRRKALAESLSARSGDQLSAALGAELKEMQERMANQQQYEASGRAYMLSGLSSHSWQRATARGNSTDSTSLIHAYQTPSMVDMLQRSQTMCPTPPRPPIRPTRSFPAQPRPG